MDPGTVSRKLIALCILLFVSNLVLASCLAVNQSPAYKLFTGLTKADVRSALGEPSKIYGPSESMGTYGAQPVPPPKGSQEVWVYSELMKLAFVYFDKHDRVRMVFFTAT